MTCRARELSSSAGSRVSPGAGRVRAALISGDSGIYCLWMRLKSPARIRVGALGRFLFPSGYYAYIGSAQKGLRARIARHCRRRKRLRWHIDFLLTRATVVRVLVWRDGRDGECRRAAVVGGILGARCLLPGFGASDCRCSTHLWFFGRRRRSDLEIEKRLTIRLVCGKMARGYRGARNRLGGGTAYGKETQAAV